jgi:hypothetical protein
LNTDFGEAEADERVVNLTRFDLFQPEKREFFLHDAGRFSFGGLTESALPFFSRRIGLDEQGRAADLDIGIKVAGSAAGLDFGVLGARVARGGLPQAPESGVMRVAGALTDHTRVGLIATRGNAQGTGGSALWGTDYQYRNTRLGGGRTLDAHAWIQESANAGLGTGRALGASVNYPNLGLNGSAALEHIDDNFLPALGFLAEAGVTRSEGELGWWWRSAEGGDRIAQLDWNTRHTRNTGDGAERSILLNPEIYVANAAGDFLLPEIFVERDRVAAPFELVPGLGIAAGDYRWHYVAVEAGTSAARPLALTASARVGGFYDGRRYSQELKTTWRPNRHWGLRVTAERNDLDLPGGRFIVRTASLRLDHAASTRLSSSLLVQWDNLSGELGASARLRWTPLPGREVFVSLNRQGPTGEGGEPLQTSASMKLVWNWTP